LDATGQNQTLFLKSGDNLKSSLKKVQDIPAGGTGVDTYLLKNNNHLRAYRRYEPK